METVHSKLRRMESLLKQIPEETRNLYQFRVFHNEFDGVGVHFYLNTSNSAGWMADAVVSVEVKPCGDSHTVDIKGKGVWITLYGGISHPMSNITIL
jgi:hypothetical protein